MPQPSHRERLLRGAIDCLQRKGYARTTARDIAAAADANLASIGYHFGSKEALLNEALIGAFERWTRQLGELTLVADLPPAQRLTIAWRETLDGFREHRALVVAFVEAMAQVERSEQLREQFASHYRSLRDTVAGLLDGSPQGDPPQPNEQAQTLAAILVALCDGLALQWLLDPHAMPDLPALLETIGGPVSPGAAPGSRRADC